NVALNTAISNPDISVALFSLEMPAEHLVNRMISTRGQIPGDHVRTGKLNKSEWNAFNHAADTIKQQRIFIDDSGYIKTTDIFSKCRKLATDENLGLIVIDYIQLISSNNERENRQEQVSKISRELKGLARELNVPVLALSQLSRQVESRQDKRPILSDLRESGSLEQDADIVMMLYRDSYYNRSDTDEPTPELELVELDIAKHRNGRTGTLNFQFQSSTGAFTSIASERR
ncbi:MAG TPA: AAA family ATPase, partial [Erysipelothrix sp.]|nr:AAA family ATPase [Erysipelothrix sp.]